MATSKPKRTHRKHFTAKSNHFGYSASELARLGLWLDSVGSTTDDRNEADRLIEDLSSFRTRVGEDVFIPSGVESRVRGQALNRLGDREPTEGSLLEEVINLTSRQRRTMRGDAIMRIRKERLLNGDE